MKNMRKLSVLAITVAAISVAAVTMGPSLVRLIQVRSGGQGQSDAGQVPAPQAAAPGPTSFELIEQALAAKAIDEETAHKYRVFAGFGDTRLPAQYRSSEQDPKLLEAIGEAGRLLNAFSAQTRAELAPFFKRPDEPGSWITLNTLPEQQASVAPSPRFLLAGVNLPESRITPASLSLQQSPAVAPSAPPDIAWQTFSDVGGRVKVWAQDRYTGDADKARALANELSSLIWNKLNGLMGPEPASDGALANNGGDNALDFYLIHTPAPTEWIGLAVSSDPAHPCMDSRYLLVDSQRPLRGNKTNPGVFEIAAHELMHAFEFAYPTKMNRGCPVPWIWEASATWAQNFVYPDTNSEQHYVPKYMLLSIEEAIDNSTGYGAYLLPYYREKTGGGTGFMPQMWDNFGRMSDLEGVNAVLAGGFKKTWPQYLLKLWNKPPVDGPDGYRQWDTLTDGAFPRGGVLEVTTPQGSVTETMGFPPGRDPLRIPGLPPLAGMYRHFKFDNTVRSLLFRNTVADLGFEPASVWGIEKIRGTWKDPADGDWTKEFQKAWCRDEEDQDLEELVIVFGNSDWEARRYLNPDSPPTLKAYATGCTAWAGTISANYTLKNPDWGELTEIVRASVRFEVDPDLVTPGERAEYWIATSGNVQWSASATGGKCTGDFRGSFSIGPGQPGDRRADLHIWDDGKPTLRYIGMNGPWVDADVPHFTYTCKDDAPPLKASLTGMVNWWQTGSTDQYVSEDGKTISGSYQMPGLSPEATLTYRWTLHASP